MTLAVAEALNPNKPKPPISYTAVDFHSIHSDIMQCIYTGNLYQIPFFWSPGDQKLESYANRFELRNPSGKLLFSADDRQVFIGADRIAVEGQFVWIYI